MKICIDYSVHTHVHISEEYIICNNLNKSSVMVKIHTITYYLEDENIDFLLFTCYKSITFFQSVYYEYIFA